MDEKELLGDGVVTGYGQVDGRLVFAFAQDFTVSGGSLGEYHAEKIVKVQNMALKMGAPIVGLQDSGGARVEEGVAALSGFGKIFHNFALLLFSVSLGSIVYYLVLQVVIWMGIDTDLLKLLSAVVVAIFLAIPVWKARYFTKPVKKGGKN